MRVKKVAPNVYAATEYAGVNVGFVVVSQGAIAIDAPTLPWDALAWRERILETAGGPILYVVLTDAHPDRLANAGLLGAPIVATRAAYDRACTYTEGFWRSVVEHWAHSYPEAAQKEISVALPEILFTDRLTLHKGVLEVTVERIAGSAPDSAWVYLEDRDVLFAGDTIVVDTHPFMAQSPDTEAWLKTLKALRRPSFSKTVIIPGRGRICGQEGVRALSDYIALMRRRARTLRSAGRARMDRTAMAAELLPLFPVAESERESVQRRVKAGLDRLYEELQ